MVQRVAVHPSHRQSDNGDEKSSRVEGNSRIDDNQRSGEALEALGTTCAPSSDTLAILQLAVGLMCKQQQSLHVPPVIVSTPAVSGGDNSRGVGVGVVVGSGGNGNDEGGSGGGGSSDSDHHKSMVKKTGTGIYPHTSAAATQWSPLKQSVVGVAVGVSAAVGAGAGTAGADVEKDNMNDNNFHADEKQCTATIGGNSSSDDGGCSSGNSSGGDDTVSHHMELLKVSGHHYAH